VDELVERYGDRRLPLWREAFAGVDWLELHFSDAYAGVGVHRGSGEPVVLVPGLMARDTSMLELKCWLERMGYDAHYSEVGRLSGCPEELADRLSARVGEVFETTRKPVTIIGHSLGGCLARRAAMKRPEHVRQVITLASPVQGARVHPAVLSSGDTLGDCSDDCYRRLQAPLPSGVAETCIFTKTDGVVDWRTCTRSTRSTNIEVRSTHVGMVWNAQVFREIGHTLATSTEREKTRPIAPRLRAAASRQPANPLLAA
jgi:triacylglycerol lipase